MFNRKILSRSTLQSESVAANCPRSRAASLWLSEQQELLFMDVRLTFQISKQKQSKKFDIKKIQMIDLKWTGFYQTMQRIGCT